MKAITTWQPWASLIAYELKRFETRSWLTKYRGRIAIHAAMKKPPAVMAMKEAWPQSTFENAVLRVGRFTDLPRGAVVATADLTFVWRTGDVLHGQVDPDELVFGDWSPGRYAWRMENVMRLYSPIPARGAQGLWNWDPGWMTFTRRTDGKKLEWLKKSLNDLGVLWRQNGESFHAPIIEVARPCLDVAWRILDPVDDMDDDDEWFNQRGER